MQRMAFGFLGPQPFNGFQPNGMPRAVVIPKPVNGFRKNLYQAGWGLQGMFLRVVPELGINDMGFSGLRDFDMALLPELVEVRQFDLAFGGLLTGNIIQMPQPLFFIPVFRKGRTKTQSFRQF